MYLDTGILVKLLTREPDSSFFEQELLDHAVVTSELAVVEIKSALFAKERAGIIKAAQRAKGSAKFMAMVADGIFRLIDLNHQTLLKAAQVMDACHPSAPLRTLDALHIAACDLAQEFPLCTTDARMRAAAREMHIPLFPEKLPPAIK